MPFPFFGPRAEPLSVPEQKSAAQPLIPAENTLQHPRQTGSSPLFRGGGALQRI